jgi:hypothetical protein
MSAPLGDGGVGAEPRRRCDSPCGGDLERCRMFAGGSAGGRARRFGGAAGAGWFDL